MKIGERKRKMFIMVGLPGSGKSTWIKNYLEENAYSPVVICGDAIRYMIHGGKYIFNPLKEGIVKKIALASLEEAITNGTDIIIDETNLTKKIANV